MDKTIDDIEYEIQETQKRIHKMTRAGADSSDINAEKMRLGQLYADYDDRRDIEEDDDLDR